MESSRQPRVTRRTLLRVSAGFGLGALASACVAPPSTPSNPSTTAGATSKPVALRDELRVALASLGNEAFDPILGPSNNLRYLEYMYDPLVGGNYKADDILKNTGIASDWTTSSDGLTYTFPLRPWKFHNGDDLTAE